ncbi:hypothetical protein BJI69_03995 [Luteibacter rhizovicinus DSM 16549]|uniref:Uncharacterized protein n=1 Tax=Luteibacter rhizovicinus DSM 16549 TaxID=1440763 RepID=A0A0G9HCV9_9GAMM|nr:hypothetical protein [Luteibacter rhizovicinus]APG03146.1 hypothetical protein BJI69_03995 [Luteibacter rhizovicinus DSM 16549]KLD67580.1 hypothetical protein Y883_06960 [Luteibacter rhizovicinus DSM 16549]KLD75004.1 hypothetical protein Y886_29535 [Xanthomonas hyacinthi DSM 19077]
MSQQELAAITLERQTACGLPVGDLRGFGRVRADASVVQLALNRDAGLLRPVDPQQSLMTLAVDGDPAWVAAYVPGTNVLESTAHTASGELRVVDFMALAEGRPGQAEAISSGRFVRIVTCTEGEVAFELSCALWTIAAEAAPAPGWHVACSRLLAFDEGVAGKAFRLTAGESVALVVSERPVQGGASLVASAMHALGDTIHYWTWWSDRCRYKAADFDAVLREALALKLACSAAGLRVEDPRASGFSAAPLGESTRAAARFLSLGYRHECVELLAYVQGQAMSATHERWPSDPTFATTLGHYLEAYGEVGLPESLCAAAHVPPPQSRMA